MRKALQARPAYQRVRLLCSRRRVAACSIRDPDARCPTTSCWAGHGRGNLGRPPATAAADSARAAAGAAGRCQRHRCERHAQAHEPVVAAVVAQAQRQAAVPGLGALSHGWDQQHQGASGDCRPAPCQLEQAVQAAGAPSAQQARRIDWWCPHDLLSPSWCPSATAPAGAGGADSVGPAAAAGDNHALARHASHGGHPRLPLPPDPADHVAPHPAQQGGHHWPALHGPADFARLTVQHRCVTQFSASSNACPQSAAASSSQPASHLRRVFTCCSSSCGASSCCCWAPSVWCCTPSSDPPGGPALRCSSTLQQHADRAPCSARPNAEHVPTRCTCTSVCLYHMRRCEPLLPHSGTA